MRYRVLLDTYLQPLIEVTETALILSANFNNEQQHLVKQTRLALKRATSFLSEGILPEKGGYIVPPKITYYD